MPIKKNKKILFYIFLFLLIGTLNNKVLNNFEFPKINQIKITGLSDHENLEVSKSLEKYKFNNLFFLDELKIRETINAYNYIERYFVFKEYPSSLNVKIDKTKFLAYVNKDNKTFYLGSNGKLIYVKETLNKLPYIFGDLDVDKFFELLKIIDNSNFNFTDIKNLFFFPSGRWDIETYSGILIKLPKSKIKESINLSTKILKHENFKNTKVLDLRQQNQIIVNDE